MMLERRIGMNIAVDKTKQVAYESMKKIFTVNWREKPSI